MKKVFLLLVVLFIAGCGNSKSDLIEKVTKEDLRFAESMENICDTTLEVENELILSKEKDESGKYKFSYVVYDCGDGAVYMTESEGTYSIKEDVVTLTDAYDNKYKFKIKSKDSIVQINEDKEVRTLKLSDKSTKEEK